MLKTKQMKTAAALKKIFKFQIYFQKAYLLINLNSDYITA